VSALGVPTTLLIGPDGQVVEVLAGEQSADDLRKALQDSFEVAL
jgi:hypothetical protein